MADDILDVPVGAPRRRMPRLVRQRAQRVTHPVSVTDPRPGAPTRPGSPSRRVRSTDGVNASPLGLAHRYGKAPDPTFAAGIPGFVVGRGGQTRAMSTARPRATRSSSSIASVTPQSWGLDHPPSRRRRVTAPRDGLSRLRGGVGGGRGGSVHADPTPIEQVTVARGQRAPREPSGRDRPPGAPPGPVGRRRVTEILPMGTTAIGAACPRRVGSTSIRAHPERRASPPHRRTTG